MSTATATNALTTLFAAVKEARLLESTANLLGWDQETMMPKGGAELRSRQLSQLARIAHETFTTPRIGELLAAAEESAASLPKDSADAVNVREIRRDYDKATKLPSALVAELAQTASQAQHVWIEARKESNFKKFQPWLEKTVKLNIDKAECLGWSKGGEAWDALADHYEPALTAAAVTAVFEPLRTRLQQLLDRIRGAKQQPSNAFNEIALPIESQEKFVRYVAKRIGFNFDNGRLDRSTHPFCGGSHGRDVRMTTRYNLTCVLDALGSTMHESGHGMYEQGHDFNQVGLPMGEAAGLSVHESQSRMWENQVGRGRNFWTWARPQLSAFFGDACDHFTLDHLYQAANVVEPGFIRVESDEATYNMHVMIRFKLERAMLKGDMAIGDLPGFWNKLYKEYLGVTVPDDRRGCLQDVHWSMGAIGYFPTYTLGTLLAAQLFEKARKDIPGLDEGFSRGEFAPLLAWLRKNVHCEARRYRLDELCRKVTGAPLSADPMMRHLESKLLPLYGLS
ncbi:MAG: carboxypeptidase M32 [Planctomycetes bacterium]|nr:carboxypeptidase M32 [Planctomycetota bacterium]